MKEVDKLKRRLRALEKKYDIGRRQIEEKAEDIIAEKMEIDWKQPVSKEEMEELGRRVDAHTKKIMLNQHFLIIRINELTESDTKWDEYTTKGGE